MALSTCSQCHAPLAAGDDVCSHCGAFVSPPATTYPRGNVSSTPPAAPATCPACRASIQPGDDICERCGAILPAGPLSPPVVSSSSNQTAHAAAVPPNTSRPTVCPRCHAPVKQDDEFCDRCGALLDQAPSPDPPTLNPPSPATTTGSAPSAPKEQEDLCPRCQTPRRADKKFCRQCGYRFPLALGDTLANKYRLEKQIGRGGMGAVWLAEDIVLHRKVVIKALLNSDNPDLVAQSVKEREFLARLNHGHIVSIYDCVAQGNEGYIVMEYIHGKTLEDLLEERQATFDVPTAINYILGILPAFAYLAKLNMVYCDFKPTNIMIEMREDGVETPKLIDLGTVIKYGPRPDHVYGTHGYYAREAVKNPSPQTDLYSICRTLAYLITGMDLDRPQFGLPPADDYPEFQQYPALYRLLYKGTHDDPARRFQSPEELEEQLRGVLRFSADSGGSSVLFESRKFVSSSLASTGRMGKLAQTALDTQDLAFRNLRHGDQALQNGNYTGALNFYHHALQSNPQSVDAYARLVDTYLEQEQVKDAEQLFASVPRNPTNHWKVRWSEARLHETRREWARAERIYQDLLLDLPGETPPLQALARVYAQQSKTQAAIQLYEYVLKADPGNVETLFAIAHCLLQQRRWDDAIRHLSAVSETSSRYIDAQVLLCDIHVHRSLPDLPHEPDIIQAAEIVRRLKGHIADARYYLLRGEVYYLAWLLAQQGGLSTSVVLADAAEPGALALGEIAENSYKQYLRSEQHLAPREEVIRRKFAVTSWRF